MRTLKQSPSLKTAFQVQIEQKKTSNSQNIHESLGSGFLGSIGTALFEVKQVKNQIQGSVGEWGVSLLLKSLPDSWVMFNNALIPTTNSRTLTEVDHIIIGSGGVFLIEVKTWKGSFSACNDKWKRREGNNWVVVSNSPTAQSVYHQNMFNRWITTLVPNLPNGSVNAPVVFPIAKWIGATNCSVPVLQGVPALLQLINSSPNCLTPVQVQEIAEGIEDYIVPVNMTSTSNFIPKPIKRQNR